MTKINKLELKGFKSFAKRSDLKFGDNFNCVVGPNGSGKSNILDALCFVLGRASVKGLRTEKSANLIYNGGKSKKPAKDGEVSIYLDNTNNTFPVDSEEVKISRIIKHNGTGVYKINDDKVTKQEIMNMLSHAKITSEGFNIVLQGDIVKFVDMKPEERRKIIEEVSGVAVYEEKRAKTINELSKVDTRINEADIILKEREGYLNELKSERDQAVRYNELKDKIDFNKGAYIYKKIKSRQEKVDKILNALEKNKEQEEKLRTRINEIQADINNNKAQIEAINKEIEEKGEKEQVQLQKKIEASKVELAKNSSRIKSIEAELTRVLARKKQLDEQNSEMQSKIDLAKSEKEGLEKKQTRVIKDLEVIAKSINKFKEKYDLNQDLDHVYKEIDEKDAEEEKMQKEIAALRLKQQEAMRKKDKYEILDESLAEKYEKLAVAKKENSDQLTKLENMRAEFKKTTQELNIKLNQDSTFAAQIKNARDKSNSVHDKLAKLQTKQASIASNAAGDAAIQHVINQRAENPLIYGMISELGSVNENYSTALEMCAGGRIRDIVVHDDKIAQELISELKYKQIGACRFLPLNKIKPKPIEREHRALAQKPGVIGFAIELVEFDPKYANAFSHVFSNTLVVQDLNAARKIGIGSIRMVTLEGDIVEGSGAMIGGFRKKSKGGSGFAQKELTEEISRLERDYEDTLIVLEKLENQRSQNMENLDRLRSFKAELDGDIKSLEKRLNVDGDELGEYDVQKETLKNQINEIEAEVDEIMEEISNVNRVMAQIKVSKTQLKNKIAEQRSPKILAELNTFEQKKKELDEERIKTETQINALDNQIKNVMNLEDSQTFKIIKAMEKEIEDFEKEEEQLTEINKKLEAELKEDEKQAEKFYQQFKDLFHQRSDLESKNNEMTGKISNVNFKIREIENQNNNHNIEKAKFNAEIMGLEAEYEPYKNEEREKQYDELKKEESILKGEITRWEKEIFELGNINLKALEMYEVVEREFNELVGKKNQLAEEKEKVLLMLNEIETKKKEVFLTTFNQVNDYFKNIFLNLCTKGDAYLELENEEQPFEGGLSVKVKLSSNKFMDIKSLSGGEKTMTTLAFIFAIQEYDPHSFYILDEIDAALDKHNSETLAQYIRNYSHKAQYIVISHNDAVISESDNLYGISMNEHGISNVTALKL